MIRSIIQLLSRLFLLLCVGWSSVASLRAQVQHAVSDLVSGTYYRIRTANSRAEALANGYLADESGMVKAQAFSSTDADVQLWLVTAVTGKRVYYTIQNKRTKMYLQGSEDTESKIATSSTATEVYVPKNTKTGRKYETWYNIMTSADAAYSYNWRDDLCMRGYQPNDGNNNDNLSGSEWRFEVTYADEDVYMAAEGHVLPVAGDKVYRIFNASSPFSDKAIYEYDNALGSITDDSNDAQYWQLVAQSNGTMAIQNLKTGHYVQSLNGMKNTQYKVGTKPYGFTISKNSNKIWILGYDIIDAESSTKEKLGLNCTDKPNGAIYSWTMFDGSKDLNSCWHFKDAGLTEEEIATIKANRTAFAKEDLLTDMLSNAKVRIKSRRAVAGHQTRAYVTDLTNSVTDNAGTCRMQVALTDGDEGNRQIWIAEKSGTGYNFRNYYTGKYLNYTNTGDARTFYIRYNPDNATDEYYVHLSEKSDFSGKGLHYQVADNVVMDWDVNATDYEGCDWLFERVDLTDDAVYNHFDKMEGRLTEVVTDQYVIIRDIYNTVMTENIGTGTGDVSKRNAEKYIQCWKFVPVEGKAGYYQLQNALTGHYINFAAFNTQCTVTSTAPNGGFKVNKISNYPKFNTYFDFTISGRESHGLHSHDRILVWNTYATDGSIASMWSIEAANITEAELTAAKLAYAGLTDELAAADTYKAAIGTFFSDAACTTLQPTYQAMSDDELKTAMTTAGITSTNLQNMAVKVKNNSWAKWEKTFRELFRRLRKDPLKHSKGSQDNPTPASGDYLKFAVKCAEVAQEDLSEFFEAYGFFRPYDLKYVGDYGDYYVTCTQEMADDAKAKIKACGKPNGNILFVENHIKHEPQQDHDGNLLYDAQGNVLLRTDYDTEDAVGKCGDVGSYSEYVAGNYANGYTYTRSGNTITMTGEGAVGYKVYDKDGNLLYFANTNSFVLPQTVADKLAETGQKMVLKVAQADGTDVTLPAADATKYTLKVYRADALTTDKCATVYTDGTEATLPTIKNNELVYIEATDVTVPTTLTEQTNYVNAADNTAYKLVLTDKQDFYAPSAFTAQTVTYSRANTAGYNSVCLPFAISAADFGSEARLEQFTSTDGQSVSLTSTTDENAAGQPCFVYCPKTQTEWTLTKQNAHIVAEPIEASDGNAVLHGSFTNAAIGAGQYKLTADGTAFGVTTNKGKVTAFRTYLTPATTAGAAALLQVLHDGAEVTGVNTAVQPAGVNQPAAVYDLTGRRVQRITRPGIYIVNGKKTVVRM